MKLMVCVYTDASIEKKTMIKNTTSDLKNGCPLGVSIIKTGALTFPYQFALGFILLLEINVLTKKKNELIIIKISIKSTTIMHFNNNRCYSSCNTTYLWSTLTGIL